MPLLLLMKKFITVFFDINGYFLLKKLILCILTKKQTMK